jgi:saccharopine dehydrogenase (NADP+, L-glutamate forming)
MQHRFAYELNGNVKMIRSSMVTKGDNGASTAMAKTVGLPLAIATKLLLTGKIARKGVVIPTTADFYEPILEELRHVGVMLTEEEE